MLDGSLGHYRILDKLGEGGMSEVYLARDTKLDRAVALKVLPPEMAGDPERLERFRSEAMTLAALSHPSIVTVHSVEEAAGCSFFTMELVDGHNLEALVRPGGLGAARLIDIASSLAEALAAAHEQGVVHRDLKPANVMLTASGHLKVLDFGLARRAPLATEVSSDAGTESLEADGRLYGTLAYMAPEQVQGKAVEPRTDLFALGVLVYELAAGRRPFRGDTAADLVASILRDRPPSLAALRSDLPRSLPRLVERCLEKDPSSRPCSAREVLESLAGCRRDLSRVDGAVRSIAVLPFADMSAEQDQAWFCEGIAEEIVDALNRVHGVRVASRASSFRFGGSALDIRQIGRHLDVDVVLEGSVRKSGDRLRITAQLVSTEDGYDVWSKSFDRRMEDIFAIQDEIARSIAAALELTLSPQESSQISRTRTHDIGAYEYYLRGRKFFAQYRRRGIEFAEEMFRRAIELDPGFAAAWAGVSDCCAFLYANAQRDAAVLECALTAAEKALKLDPDLAEAHVAHAVALSYSGRPEHAWRKFEEALRLNPRLFEAEYFAARHAFSQGERQAAIEHYARAERLRPEDYQSPLLAAQIHEDLGRNDEAERSRVRGVEKAEMHLRLHPDDVRALYMAANALVAVGRVERGLQWAARARQLDPEEPMLLYNLACIFSLAARTDEAIDCLRSSLRHGFGYVEWIEQDGNLDAVRGDPRFQALMESLGRTSPEEAVEPPTPSARP